MELRGIKFAYAFFFYVTNGKDRRFYQLSSASKKVKQSHFWIAMDPGSKSVRDFNLESNFASFFYGGQKYAWNY